MTMQKLFFRVMLGSLALAAVCGVLAILTANYVVLGRVAATAAVTAITAAVMNRLGELTRTDLRRLIGHTGIGLAGLCFLLTLVAIWTPGESWRWWMTALAIASTTPLLLAAWQLAQWPPAWLAGRVGFGLACVLFVGWLVAIWHPDASIMRWSSVVATIGVFGPLIVSCLIEAKWDQRSIPRWVGVGCAVLGAIWSLSLIYLDTVWDSFTARLLWVLTSVPVFIALANLCQLMSLRPQQKWVRTVTVAAILLALVGFDWLVLVDDGGGSLFGRLTGASAIVAGCGFVALIILTVYNRVGAVESPFAKADVSPPTPFKYITVFCPRCQTQQEIPLIYATCGRCALRICVQLQEADP
jgi:hypothetical protein